MANDISSVKNRILHFKEATKNLHKLILDGVIDRNNFSTEQLDRIFKDADRIPDFTWHHHQDVGRMQLVPEKMHAKTGHIGGFDLWFK